MKARNERIPVISFFGITQDPETHSYMVVLDGKKICPECNQEYNGYWCKPCNSKHFQNDFDKWTSGNNTIDKLIQDAQINANTRYEAIEWIPYDRFKDIKEIAKGGFGTIYKAKWIDGQIKKWDIDNQQWERLSQLNVALKKLNSNFASLNEDFLNEVKYLLISDMQILFLNYILS